MSHVEKYSPDYTKDNLKQMMSFGGDHMIRFKEKMDKTSNDTEKM